MASPGKVNDLVKIDGQLVGKVVNIIMPWNTFSMYVVRSARGASNTHQKMSGALVFRSLPLSVASTCPQNMWTLYCHCCVSVFSHVGVKITSQSLNTVGLKSSSLLVVGSVFSVAIFGRIFNINIESRQVGIPSRDELAPLASCGKRRHVNYSDSSSDEEY